MSSSTQDSDRDLTQAYLDGLLSPQEEAAFLQQTEQSPAMLRDLQLMESVTHLLDNEPALAPPAYLVDNVMESWVGRQDAGREGRSWLLVAGLAALDAALVTGGILAMIALGPEAAAERLQAVWAQTAGTASTQALRQVMGAWLTAGAVTVGLALVLVQHTARRQNARRG